MLTLELPNKGEFLIPSDWDELSHNQVNDILKLALKLITAEINYDAFIVKAFYIISGIKRNWLSVFKEKRLRHDKRLEKFANIYQTAEVVSSFLFQEKKQQLEFYYNTVQNFFPTIKVNNNEFVGPATLLANISFGQFRQALEATRIYSVSKSDTDLNKFLAIIYRPKYGQLISKDPEGEGKYFAKVQPHIKLGIFLWFTTCVYYLTTSEINIGGRLINFGAMFGNNGGDAEEKTGEVKKDNGIGWIAMLFYIAKENVFGDADKVDERNLYDVLLLMYDNYLKDLKLKARTKK